MKTDYHKNVLLFEVDFNDKKCHLCVKKHKKIVFCASEKIEVFIATNKKIYKKKFS